MKNKEDTAIKMELFTNDLFGNVRSILINREPWFVGSDIARCLGYKDADQALRKNIDNDDKLIRLIDGSGQSRNMVIINESGVYSLIFSSKLPKAKEFKHWVTHDILPAMRKIGFDNSQKLIYDKVYEKGKNAGQKRCYNNISNNFSLISDLYKGLDIAAERLNTTIQQLLYDGYLANNEEADRILNQPYNLYEDELEDPFIYFDKNGNEVSKDEYNKL